MPTPSRASHPAAIGYPQAIAFSVQLGRNQIVQAVGLSMVALVGLSAAKWPWVLGWTLIAVCAVASEDLLLRRIARVVTPSKAARIAAPALRILVTTVYAAAAFVLLVKGGAGEKLFAFALMSASMVHVLMRYYRSPWVLMASLAPYLIILALVGLGLVRTAIQGRHWLAALAPVFGSPAALTSLVDPLAWTHAALFPPQQDTSSDVAKSAAVPSIGNAKDSLFLPLSGQAPGP